MTNPILKAHLEGVEMFKKNYPYLESGSNSDGDLFITFLTTYGINILKAAKEAGPGKIKMIHAIRAQSNAGAGHTIGHNSAVSSFHSAIDKGIEGIRKGDKC